MLKQKTLFLIVLFVSLLCASQSLVAKQNRVALVIGNASYKDAPLDNPRNDATDMANKLKKFGFEVEKLIDANERSMKRAINRFGKKLQQKNTVGLFYFAGHGVQVKGNNYLLPIGADINSEADVEFEAVNAARVLSQMSLADNGLNMLILDACRNNPYARSFRSSTRGLARMEAPSGSLILYATSPGNVAADGTGRNGLFTEKLMKSMDKQGLKIEDVFKQTAIAVSQASGKQQVPYIEGVILGNFYFQGDVTISKPNIVTVPAPKPINYSRSTENLFWESVQEDPSKEMYEAYLKEYPTGYYARIAKIKLKRYTAKPTKTYTSKSSTATKTTTPKYTSVNKRSTDYKCRRSKDGYYFYNKQGKNISTSKGIVGNKSGIDHLVYDENTGTQYICEGYYNFEKKDDNPKITAKVVYSASDVYCRRGKDGYYIFDGSDDISGKEKDKIIAHKVGNDHMVIDKTTGKQYLCKNYYKQKKQDSNPFLVTDVLTSSNGIYCKRGKDGYYLFDNGEDITDKKNLTATKKGNDHLVYDKDTKKHYKCVNYYSYKKQDGNPFVTVKLISPPKS
jgi:hypothetical protein